MGDGAIPGKSLYPWTWHEGDVDIAGVIQTLEGAGYQGWYVIEQDTAITDGLPAEGEGPIHQVTTSMQYLVEKVAPTLESAPL